MAAFNPLEPFSNKKLLNEAIKKLTNFEFKLYGKIPLKFYDGKPDKYEFDLNLGLVHFTEQDFRGISKIFAKINKKWGRQMMYCLYPAKESNRNMILNVRGSPKAPSTVDKWKR